MNEWNWSLDKINEIKKNGLRVVSCFSCGGGSTLGYKLAGFEVIGNVEIDPAMMKLYKKNHNPKYPFEMPIQEFNRLPISKIPKEFFNIDILDGSPPCSTFSVSGKREQKWGGAFSFREGQAKQRLDDLFFDFIETADRLQPKVIVAENVVGLILGKARGYVSAIIEAFDEIGYTTQLFKLNAATMGVPQKRERVFFVCHRKDLNYPKLRLEFNEQPITYGKVRTGKGRPVSQESETYKRWKKRRPKDRNFGDIMKREIGRDTNFSTIIFKNHLVPNTVTASSMYLRDDVPEFISNEDIIRIQTFPYDYDFMDQNVQYVCGMSVPPIMMKKIAEQIYLQWLK
ncbi:DNA cytosine methyltransferase [Enterococcus casseliflavus]|uniref:DNA cytosine methyltransferase n=1 Tax=Enterococcus casseliflavus TaxID=37734 RepID=UPI0039A5ADFA